MSQELEITKEIREILKKWGTVSASEVCKMLTFRGWGVQEAQLGIQRGFDRGDWVLGSNWSLVLSTRCITPAKTEYITSVKKTENIDDSVLKWHNRYLDLAEHVSTWSKDPSTCVGSVAIGEHGQVLSVAYNGFPRGVDDSEDRLTDREKKYKLIVHAEMNVIYNASLSGVSLKGATLYTSGLPTCSHCALGVIQSGVSHVVVRERDISKSEKWRESWDDSASLFNEADVKVTVV